MPHKLQHHIVNQALLTLRKLQHHNYYEPGFSKGPLYVHMYIIISVCYMLLLSSTYYIIIVTRLSYKIIVNTRQNLIILSIRVYSEMCKCTGMHACSYCMYKHHPQLTFCASSSIMLYAASSIPMQSNTESLLLASPDSKGA